MPDRVAVIGAGPAGLMAAETLALAGYPVDVYDAMPSVARKFLLAGKGGMNITHSEPLPAFIGRYGPRAQQLDPVIRDFDPDALRAWVDGLGVGTFVGTSGRVFPTDMKAAPLLRAWLQRLREAGVRFHMRHRWVGWDEDGALRFVTGGPVAAGRAAAQLSSAASAPASSGLADDSASVQAAATVLALGGASWPRLGSDGAWVPLLSALGTTVAPLKPANCGFDIAWTPFFSDKFAGAPLRAITAQVTDPQGGTHARTGECIVTATGIEGGLIYALSAALRDAIATAGSASLTIDLAPGLSFERVLEEIQWPRGSRSMANHLRSRVRIEGVKAGLLREVLDANGFSDPQRLARTIKALPLTLLAPRPIAEAISTAGGVTFESMDGRGMLKARPGVFCAGEMLDWEAPTGGYLLTACLASGRAVGKGVAAWLDSEAGRSDGGT
jgi:uncharacterized flavoprotein (TIGR03862 family)